MPDRIGQRIRRAVFERAEFHCEYCKSPADYSAVSLSIEHIIPRCRGGGSELSNLCLSCQGCNSHKYTSTTATDPLTGTRVPLFNPRTDEWSKHFAWGPNALEVIPTTAVGRGTVSLLRLNRRGVVGLRRALVAIGKHPPVA